MRLLTLLSTIALSQLAFSQHLPTYARKVDNPKPGILVNRYMYVGNAPRFNKQDLEVTASKMMLTLRVKAWVTNDLRSSYRTMMLKRWNRLNTNLETTSMEIVPLRNPEEIIQDMKDPAQKNWASLAAAYMSNGLEKQGVEIYNNGNARDISTAVLRYLLQNSSLTIEDGKSLLNQSDDPMASRILFSTHFNSIFTPDTSRSGYIGYLTFVYPIADHSKGPFGDPEPGEYFIGNGFSKDLYHKGYSYTLNEHGNHLGQVFGGFPFLIYVPGRSPKYATCDINGTCTPCQPDSPGCAMVDEGHKGIAFHGPVDDQSAIGARYSSQDGPYTGAWYLQRNHVSHGCNRMDGNDVMELATILPDLSNRANKVKIKVTDWPDVFFDSNTNQLVVADVDYYGLPTSRRAKATDTIDQLRNNWFKNVLAASLKRSDRPETKFDLSSKTFFNLEVPTSELSKTPAPNDQIPLKTYQSRGVRLIEYTNGPSPIDQFIK